MNMYDTVSNQLQLPPSQSIIPSDFLSQQNANRRPHYPRISHMEEKVDTLNDDQTMTVLEELRSL